MSGPARGAPAGAAQRRFDWMYGLYFAGYMSFFSFYGVYLSGRGHGPETLALLSSGTAAANLAALVVSGLAADRIASPRRVLLGCAVLSGLWGLLFLPAAGSAAAALWVVAPVSALDFALMGALDAWTNAAARQTGRVRYSAARAFGSLSGAAVSTGLGYVLHAVGQGQIGWFHLGFFLLLAAAAWTGGDAAGAPAPPERGQRRFFAGYWLFLLAALLLFLGWRSLLTYLPALVVEQGGDSRQQGLIMAELSVCSMAGLWLYPLLRRRWSAEALLCLGAAAMVLRLGCMTAVGGLGALAAVQLLELASYGLFHPAAMEFLRQRALPGSQATCLSLYTALQMPAGTILANLLAVRLLDAGGWHWVFTVFALLALAGGALLAAVLRADGKRNGR